MRTSAEFIEYISRCKNFKDAKYATDVRAVEILISCKYRLGKKLYNGIKTYITSN